MENKKAKYVKGSNHSLLVFSKQKHGWFPILFFES